MSKLTHFALPRGWVKGEEVMLAEGPFSGRPAISLVRTLPEFVESIYVQYLVFDSEDVRKQWLKWWRKP